MKVAIDFGITNTDIAVLNDGDINFSSIPSKKINNDFLKEVIGSVYLDTKKISKIAVTGGKSSDLNDLFDGVPIIKVNEIDANR